MIAMGQRRATDRLDAEGRRIVPRAVGCVILLYDRGWEDENGLLPVSEPLPFEEWVAATRAAGYTVGWVPEGAIVEGSYAGGVVVEVSDDSGRSYAAVPPELLDRLREVMAERDYRMVCEDVAALANPEARGVRVTRLDPAAWERRREVAPTGELSTEAWARAIREHSLRVEIGRNGALSMEGTWPGGHVIAATDGKRRYYFAVPRAGLRLVTDLAVETSTRPTPSSSDRDGHHA